MAAEAEEKKGKDIFTEAMESSVANTAANITGTADFLIGKPLESLGWEDNFISEWNSYYQDKAEEKHWDVMKAAERTGRGKSAEITGEILTLLGEAGIDAALSAFTGGALAAAKLGSKGGKVLKYADDVGDAAKKKGLVDDIADIHLKQSNKASNERFMYALKSRKNNGIVIKKEQFGKKNKRHAKDYGLNPAKEEDRIKLLNIIDDILTEPDEIVRGRWKGQEETILFYRKGEDLVLVKENDNEFVSIFKGGANNGWFKNM